MTRYFSPSRERLQRGRDLANPRGVCLDGLVDTPGHVGVVAGLVGRHLLAGVPPQGLGERHAPDVGVDAGDAEQRRQVGGHVEERDAEAVPPKQPNQAHPVVCPVVEEHADVVVLGRGRPVPRLALVPRAAEREEAASAFLEGDQFGPLHFGEDVGDHPVASESRDELGGDRRPGADGVERLPQPGDIELDVELAPVGEDCPRREGQATGGQPGELKIDGDERLRDRESGGIGHGADEHGKLQNFGL